MEFHEKLRNYASLLVKRGLNVQPGQLVFLGGEVCQRELLFLLAEQAYEAGAKFVHTEFTEPRLQKLRVLHSSVEDMKYVPEYLGAKYREMVDSGVATLRLCGLEYPELLSDLDPVKLNTSRKAFYGVVKYFYDEGIGKSKVQWSLGAAATEGWAKRLFPHLAVAEAEGRLWDEIFRACRVDTTDFLERWDSHNQILQKRASTLSSLGISQLHFTGPGTDLKVGLSEKSLFKGGAEAGPGGVTFEPNIPTEECFTTPDYRRTEGKVAATRPFLVNGKLIRDLTLEFSQGRIVHFSASEGEDTFREYIESDEGAKRLGEVALVGVDSPIFQSGVVFEEILFDENAACHIAIGSAYKFCLQGGESMSEEELSAVGWNESSVHTDIMISSEKVHVDALLWGGESVRLIESGSWKESRLV